MNAIILAAGTSSRFVPLSSEYPKGLLEVKGEILIERQIRQLQEAGIYDITLVLGYMADKFTYLNKKFGVSLVINEDYSRYNNTSSVIRVIEKLSETYICSSDNYFPNNVFLEKSTESYYSALYAKGDTKEYCLEIDNDDYISKVSIGGKDTWYMTGHVYMNNNFSKKFCQIMEKEYQNDATKQEYWEDVYIRHLNELPKMKIHRYSENEIHEFDTIDELRLFDTSYVNDTRSFILKQICKKLGINECEIYGFIRNKHEDDYLDFNFCVRDKLYRYKNINGIHIEKL